MALAHRRWGMAAKIQAELQNKLLDKFSSAPEMVEYLRTDAGRFFLDTAVTERVSPYSKILSSSQAGAVLSAVGCALFMVRSVVGDPEELAVLAAISLALGIGFLISAGISYVLSKSWGLFNGAGSQPMGE